MALSNYFITKDIYLDQNVDFNDTELYDPNGVAVDLSAYSATAMIRGNKTDVSPLLTFTSTPLAGLVLNAGSVIGAVQWSITSAQFTTLLGKLIGLAGFYSILLYDASNKHIPFKSGALYLIRGANW